MFSHLVQSCAIIVSKVHIITDQSMIKPKFGFIIGRVYFLGKFALFNDKLNYFVWSFYFSTLLFTCLELTICCFRSNSVSPCCCVLYLASRNGLVTGNFHHTQNHEVISFFSIAAKFIP